MGWPGMTTVRAQGEGRPSHAAPYHESWGFLQRYRPYRGYLCPDGTSEFTDISFGDPWHRQLDREEAGHSLVLARTPKGQAVVREAMEAGYVSLQRVRPDALIQSQKNLFSKRASIYGRLLTLKLFGVPSPRLEGFYLFRNWLILPLGDKARSVFASARRIVQRKYYREMAIVVDPENERRLGHPGDRGPRRPQPDTSDECRIWSSSASCVRVNSLMTRDEAEWLPEVMKAFSHSMSNL
jgi:coenzyme F420 hydrogenase subunit beta